MDIHAYYAMMGLSDEVKNTTLKENRAYSTQFSPGLGPSMVVGLPQTWPLLAPLPDFTDGPSFTTSPPFLSWNFSLNGHTLSSISTLIEDFCDKWTGSGTEAAATLASQLFCDNKKQLYVLITDVASYPITSKPELWQLTRDEEQEEEQEQQQNQEHFFLLPEDNDEKVAEEEDEPLGKTETVEKTSAGASTISFSSLFNVGQEIFALFLFSPTDIVFTLETNTQQAQLSNIFFHGRSRVSVSASQNPRVITIHFLEKEKEDQKQTKTQI
ncbi:unnamed protein product [Orchesella dallaii]|uniref:Uncharacterized protein n=1 Tax=Orchesella dallaii TaxID=48710 RepID=A0ABP1QVB1_9HEXA